jgi:murein hydrolase activator
MKKYFITAILFCLIYTSVSAQHKKTYKSSKSKLSVKKKAGSKAVAYKSIHASKKKRAVASKKSSVSKKRLAYSKSGGKSRKRSENGSIRKHSNYTYNQLSANNQLLTDSKTARIVLSREDELYANGLVLNRGKLPWPVNGEISIPYGDYTIEGTKVKGRNPGITIATPQKDMPVMAVSDGVVSRVDNEGEVVTVFIRHGNYCTVYSNLSSIEVSKGTIIKAGGKIGTVGEAYASAGGELNFLLMKEKDNLNPTPWFSAN